MSALFLLGKYFKQESVLVFRVLDNIQFSSFSKVNCLQIGKSTSLKSFCIVLRQGNKIHVNAPFRTGPEVIKLFSCSTQLSKKF